MQSANRPRARSVPATAIPQPIVPDTAPNTVHVLERSARLLVALADSPRARTLQELGKLIGCSTSTVHRMLTTLADFYLVEKDPVTRRYRLGLGVFHLADARARQSDVRAVAKPRMEWLADYSLETVSLHVLMGRRVLCVEAIESTQELRLIVNVGRERQLAELGAKSKALLAYLPTEEQDSVLDEVDWERVGTTRAALREELARTVETGITRSFGERVAVAASLAAPIFDHRGQIIASLSIAGPKGRWTPEQMDAAEPALRTAALDTSHDLGYRADGFRPGRPT
jgi:DNA-binding IclR family transcriptional regulator